MKVTTVAAAISVMMIHSSSRSRMRSSTRLILVIPPRAGEKLREGAVTGIKKSPLARRRRCLRLWRDEARGLVDLVDEILAEAALHLLVHRHQLGHPGLLLLVGEIVELDLAGGLDS